MIELPVHLKIASQVGPAVAPPNVTARNVGKRNRGRQRQPCSFSFGNQDSAARHPQYIAAVAPASDFKMGRAQGVEPEAGYEQFVTGYPGVLKNAGQVRISDDLLDDGIAPSWIRIRTAVSQAVVRQTLQF